MGFFASREGGRKPESELDRLSNILKSSNEQFGTLFNDAVRVARRQRLLEVGSYFARNNLRLLPPRPISFNAKVEI